jgi:CRISPR system Cascade subunit CasB
MTGSTKKLPDFERLWQRYKELKAGPKAELRRVAEPDELREKPALYQLLPGAPVSERLLRVVFIMPWLAENGPPRALAKTFAEARVGDKRLYQVLRAQTPNDLIQLRRIVQQVRPAPEWSSLGHTLFFWGVSDKRRLLEDFLIATTKPYKPAAGA